jgi:hypothetical protein
VIDDRAGRLRDGGYVIALTALLMIPLMAFIGFAVDLGAWYARAGQIQAASDSASLAGVTYLPDFAAAEAAALAVAERNGFVDGVDGVTVDVVDLGSQQLRVDIRDSDVSQFFTTVFSDDVQVERGATAEYILPVAMGSPRNYLGTGSDPGDVIATSRHENFWLAISGPCASRENGDYLSAVSDANYYFSGGGPYTQNPGPVGGGISWNRCTGADAEGTTINLTDGTTGDSYDPNGYFYAIEVPPSRAGQALRVDVYDAAHCQSSNAGDSSASTATNRRFVTRYRLRAPDPNPYIPEDNPLVSGQNVSFTSGTTDGVCATTSGLTSGGYRNGWRQLVSVASAQAGIYFVQINTEYAASTPGDAFQGTNGFGLRARFGSTFTECSADPNETAIYSASCAQVYAVDYMGVLANLQGSYPTFFLADIGPEHSGKDMVIGLFDPGEGALRMEILDPLGRSVDFSWEVVPLYGTEVTPTGGNNGVVDQPGAGPCSLAPPSCSEIDVLGLDPQGDNRGWNPQPGPYYGSRSKYSARKLQLVVELPENIATEYSGRTWWRVRYHAGTAPTDRTTWSVKVLGDPVRLVD